jgi:hypothetical protein
MLIYITIVARIPGNKSKHTLFITRQGLLTHGKVGQSAAGTEIWSTWIVGAANAFGNVGEQTASRLFVAVVEGVAPDVVVDMDGNGVLNKKDLKLMGYKVISNTPQVDFIVNGL